MDGLRLMKDAFVKRNIPDVGVRMKKQRKKRNHGLSRAERKRAAAAQQKASAAVSSAPSKAAAASKPAAAVQAKTEPAVPRQTTPKPMDEPPMIPAKTAVLEQPVWTKAQHTPKTAAKAASKTETETCTPSCGLFQRISGKIKWARHRWRHILHEEKAHRFPESERKAVQFLLLMRGIFPALRSRIRERVLHDKKVYRRKMTALRERLSLPNVHPAAFLGTACSLAAVILFCSVYTVGTAVSYDGQVIGAVSSKARAEAARADLERITSATLGEDYSIDESQLVYGSALMRRQEVVDQTTLEQELSDEIGLVTEAYCLYIDGELVGATPYEGALEELLEQIKAASTDENTISCSFAEDVDIRHEYVSTDKVMNLGYLAEMLYSTKNAEMTYTVVKGDTWSEIAESHDLTSQELKDLNPGYNIDKLQIGEVLTLSVSVPYLTMTVVQREHSVEQINYEIEYTDTADLFKGDYKVVSAGAYGAADVMSNVTYVNGEEVKRTVLSTVTLKEPVTEQRLQGTKERPTWQPTGTFRWPTTGRITSGFGYRSSPGGIGSTNHKGIDIAGRYGTPIYAADGGTVTYSGWMSGYGYLVQINHGNGYVTYYGHNSSLIVSVGDHVYKGQQIARMGSTGNSTGNHCHFGVYYNGVAKNPLNYLR